MSKQHKIRWKQSDNQELARVVRNFNAKLKRLEKKGLVSRDFCCKHYEYNRLLKRPPKKRNLNTERFSAEDFEI